MFKKILIANRGEIAIRIAKTLQEMGICAAGLYSEMDRDAIHLQYLDEVYPLTGKTVAQTYLDIGQIIGIAQASRAEAIHPGYGFLSENAQFAGACEQAGIAFIGPPAEAMRNLGDKLLAKRVALQAGVPVVPEFSVDGKASKEKLKAEAARRGYPLLVKAVAGGGGKGVRLVRKEEELDALFEAAKREAEFAFADSRIFIEKYLIKPRHVEFQIFADRHGNSVHLFERECSIQRRYQKIIEESPSPAMNPKLRERMGDAAVRIAKAAGYVNAGTVEFLLDSSGEFYFLEMNTRLQVEHPVTEFVTREDLVKIQILVAFGEKLPFTQEKIKQEGHAMECRIYAEDPANGFLPSTGIVQHYLEPSAPGIRVDSGVTRGTTVNVDYDPLLAKLIVWGKSRRETLRKMSWALEHYCIMGVATNLEFLQNIVRNPEFAEGKIHTQFLEEDQMPVKSKTIPDGAWIAAALAANAAGKTQAKAGERIDPSPWSRAGGWRAF